MFDQGVSGCPAGLLGVEPPFPLGESAKALRFSDNDGYTDCGSGSDNDNYNDSDNGSVSYSDGYNDGGGKLQL